MDTLFCIISSDCRSFSALQIPDERRAVVVFETDITQADYA